MLAVGMKNLSSMVSALRLILAGALISAVAVACGNAAGPPQQTIDESGGSTSTGGTGGGVGTGGIIGTGGGSSGGTGGTIVGPDGGTGGPCVRIGMIGRLPTYGAVPGMDSTAALQQWLNSKSTAVVATYVSDTPITAEFLGQYDVLILQALEAAERGPYFQYDATEVAAFEAWVRAGGGVITLTGYGAAPAEVDPTNQLMAFTGLSYAKDDIWITGSCPDNDCCCASNSVPVTGWNAAHPVAANITRVGAFYGRSVLGAGDVVAQGASVYGATKQMDMGRVFMFADEWVTYTSQWDGTGAMTCATDPAHNYCTNRLAPQYYQVPQFWYNAIKWASGDRMCFDFDADVPIVR
jgi:hypothetical protein